MKVQTECPHCGMVVREVIRASGFFGCHDCYAEWVDERNKAKRISRQPRRSSEDADASW